MKHRKNFFKTISDDFNKMYSLLHMVELSMLVFCGVFLIDCWDLPTRVIGKISLQAFVVICSTVFIVAVTKLCAAHFFELVQVKTANPIDYSLCVAFLSVAFYVIVRVMVLGWQWHTWVAVGVCIVAMGLIYLRATKRYDKIQNSTSAESKLIDLKDLYEGHVKKNITDPILLRETDVGYDLLGRETTINQLYRSIVCCQSEASYVIGLCGAWGAGKTTIINNVKRILQEKDPEYVIVDGFDPWLYGGPEALFGAMLDVLLQKTGVRYKAYLTSKKIKNIAKSIATDNMVGGLAYNLLLGNAAFGNEIDAMRERLRSYIRMSDKRYVFFIDNLDRASDDNIIFLFKMISIVFDLPGIVYVLSYEKDRINTVLKEMHEYDARFTEKIIQQEINVPSLNEESTRKLLAVCIENILIARGFAHQEIVEFRPAAEYIFKKVKNIREFKRMVNTVFSSALNAESLLNESDLLSIELIRFYEPEVYDEIWRHPQFFVSHDRFEAGAFWTEVNNERLNQKGKVFFDKLFEEKEEENKLLQSVFPFVKRYAQGDKLVSDYIIQTEEDHRMTADCRVCSGKYFDLYFSYGTNHYLEISRELNSYIWAIDRETSSNNVEKIAASWVNQITLADQAEWTLQLQLRKDEIAPEKRGSVIIGLVKSSGRADSSVNFWISPYDRICYIIAELLLKCEDNTLRECVQLAKGQYKYLYLFGRIYLFLEEGKRKGEASGDIDTVLDACNGICEEILREKIDIYEDKNYSANNCWGLSYYADREQKGEELRSFFKYILSPKNIYRFLWDCIGHSVGTGYHYYFGVDRAEKLLSDPSIVDEYINKRPPITESEIVVKEIYEKHKSESNGMQWENRYEVQAPLSLTL